MPSNNDARARIRVSVVIPVYNSENTIVRLGDELVQNLGKVYDLELVLVNDCSKDGSEASCVDLFRKYPKTVRFYSLSKNVGEHNAVMAGLNQTSGDFVLIMDDDFQNPVSSAIRLLEYAIERNYDVTYSCYSRKKHALFRNVSSSLNGWVATIMLKKPKDLYLSSFKVLNRFLVDEIIKYRLPYPYVDGLILRTTDNIGKIEVEHQKRREGKSGYTLAKLLRLWLNMFTNFSILPLRVAFGLGLVSSIVGLAFGIDIVLEKLSNPKIPLGYTSLILFILMFAGIQLMSLGVIGEYVGRIFLSMNKKPQYSIRKRYDSSQMSENGDNRYVHKEKEQQNSLPKENAVKNGS